MLNEVYAMGFRNPHTISFGKDGRILGGNYGCPNREGTFVHKSVGGVVTGVSPLHANVAAYGYIYPAAEVGHKGKEGAGFVGQAVAGGCPVENGFPMGGKYHYADFPKSENLFFSTTYELKHARTTGLPWQLSQACRRQAFIYYEQDGFPGSPPLRFNTLGDVVKHDAEQVKGRVDVRMGRSPRGELYWSSNSSGMWDCASIVTPKPSTIITNESNPNVDNAGSSVTSERVCETGPVNQKAVILFGLPWVESTPLSPLMLPRQATGEGDFERQPVYFAFNAETWGYAGSARFLRDMLEFECDEEQDISEGRKGCKKPFINNLKFKEFEGADIQVLKLGQLITPSTGNSPPTSQFFTHHDDALGKSLEEMLNNTFMSQDLSLERGGFDFDYEERVTPIDASQSFNFFFNDSRIDVVSVTNYPLNFSTEIYHSMLDTELRISQPAQRESMYKAANAIATAIVNIAFEDPKEILANSNTIDNVITCMTGNWRNFSMVREYLEL
ncbi:Nicastrin [Gracilaria domingensis]|nr:Nicastrin [Gracilaria domingensis]